MTDMEEVKGESWNQLDIKTDADKTAVASILVMNGYTVRVQTVKENNKPKKVLQYRRDRA